MDIKNLIDEAKQHSGLQLGALAEQMHISQTRISEWKRGKYRPGASQIVFLAEKAGLKALQTLAEIEASFDPHLAEYWKNAVSEMRQNQG